MSADLEFRLAVKGLYKFLRAVHNARANQDGPSQGVALPVARTELRGIDKIRWEEAWQVAIGWAYRNLKTIREDTVQLATAEVTEIMASAGRNPEVVGNLIEEIRELEPQDRSGSPGPSVRPRLTPWSHRKTPADGHRPEMASNQVESVGSRSTLLEGSVINLSQVLKLTKAQFSLLDRGLSFIPSHLVKSGDKGAMLADLGQLHARVQKAVYFGSELGTAQLKPFSVASGWVPPPQKLPGQIWDFFLRNYQDAQEVASGAGPPQNLSEAEIQALQELNLRKDIVIKPADKGSAVVIMDKQQYVQEGLRQLQDEGFYTKLRAPIFLDSVPLIEQVVDSLVEGGFINKRQAEYLAGESMPRARRFYLLPKVHKPREKWSTPYMPPGRPIVSDCRSESYRVAEFITYYLNPLSVKHPSYLKDTYDFLEKVKQLQVPAEAFLFSLDVESLYTNIEIPLGLAAVGECLARYPEVSRPDEAILQLLELSLTRNDFEFEGSYYLQIKGTAMGKRFAPAYANIYMAQWEETVFPKCKKVPLVYFRYLDDVWGVWQHSRQEFEEFLGVLNAHHASIKVKAVVEDSAIDFLDTTVYKGPDFQATGRLETKVFFKATDTHALLHQQSYHPRHTFRGIVLSQLLRFRRICSREDSFQEAKKILFKALRGRGYSRSKLRTIYQEHCRSQNGQGSLPSQGEGVLVPAIFSFSPSAVELMRRVKRNFRETLASIPEGAEINLRSAYKRNRNLGDLLVHSRLPKEGMRKRSRMGPRVIKAWGKPKAFFLPNISLNTKNCVYGIRCAKCGKQYVGQTKNSIRMRMYQHRYTIRRGVVVGSRRTLQDHFRRHGLQSLRVMGLEHNPRWTLRQRLFKEFLWIRRLETRVPNGLNIRREVGGN